MTKIGVVIFIASASLSLLGLAAQKKWDGNYLPYTLHYLMYSDSLSEAQPPRRDEQKLSFAIQGDLAKEIFDSIGPDLKLSCGTSLGMRQRERGDVDCSYDKEDKASPYTCHFGIDLKKGKSMHGAIC